MGNSVFISEINFIDDEFIEINLENISIESLNISKIKVYDENVGFNKISLIKKYNNSKNIGKNLILIVGKSFINRNNLSNLDCNIYSTNLLSPGKYGLKNIGENLNVVFENFSIFFNKTKNYNFNTNESLNINLSSNTSISYFKNLKSPCFFNNSIKFSNFTNLKNYTKINSTYNFSSNLTLSNISINYSLKNYNFKNCSLINNSFKIISNEVFNDSKIKFKFSLNNSFKNFSIKYWIEDFNNKIVKNKIITKNLNYKSFTPKDFSNIYFLKSKFIINNSNFYCEKNLTKRIFYYSSKNSYLIKKQIIIKDNTKKSSNFKVSSNNNNNNNNSNNNLDLKTKFEILNKDDFLNNKTKFLKYKITKGNTNKRSVYFYLNNKKIHSFQLKKNEIRFGEIKIETKLKENSFSISGLSIKEGFNFTINPNILIENKNIKRSNFFNISIIKNLDFNGEIKLKLNNNFKIKKGECYILNKKTLVSNILNLTNTSAIKNNTNNFNFKLNILNFLEIDKSLNDLKLICKYIKNKNKNLEYFSLKLKKENNKLNSSKNKILNMTNKKNNLFLNFSNSFLLDNLENKYNNDDINLKYIILNDSNIKTDYFSKKIESKSKSIYLLLIGVSTILSSLIILW